MRTVRYLAQAGEEALGAAEWYGNERPALGLDFERELAAAVALLHEQPVPSTPYPKLFPKDGVRRLMLKRFPFDLVFVERGDEVIILALAHHARRPGYWRGRMLRRMR